MSFDDSRLFNNYILCKWVSAVSLGTCFSLSLSALFSLIFSVELNKLWNGIGSACWHNLVVDIGLGSITAIYPYPMATSRELHKSKWQKLALPIIDAKEIIWIYSWFIFGLPFWTPESWRLLGCLSVCYQASSDMKGFGSQKRSKSICIIYTTNFVLAHQINWFEGEAADFPQTFAHDYNIPVKQDLKSW